MRSALHVGPSETPGGMAKVIEILSQNPPHGWSTKTHTTHVTGNPLQKYLFHKKALAKFNHLIKGNSRPNLVHIHTAADWSWKRKSRYVKVCQRFNIPCIVHIHSGKFDNWLGSQSSKKCANFRKITSNENCQVIVLSEGWSERLTPLIGDCAVVNNPIDPKIKFDPNNVRKTKQLLLLGRNDSVKGHEFAISVFNRLKLNDPEVEMVITGTDKFKLPGVRSENWLSEKEKIDQLQQSSVMLIPSLYEGQPMTMLEALYCGLNCVVSDKIIDVPDVAIQAKYGDIEDWIDKISTTLKNPRDSKLLHDYISKHSTEKINERWKLIYDRLTD